MFIPKFHSFVLFELIGIFLSLLIFCFRFPEWASVEAFCCIRPSDMAVYNSLNSNGFILYNRPMCGRSTGTYKNLGDLQRDLRGLSPTPPNKKTDLFTPVQRRSLNSVQMHIFCLLPFTPRMNQIANGPYMGSLRLNGVNRKNRFIYRYIKSVSKKYSIRTSRSQDYLCLQTV
jgi:hypothetical protein